VQVPVASKMLDAETSAGLSIAPRAGVVPVGAVSNRGGGDYGSLISDNILDATYGSMDGGNVLEAVEGGLFHDPDDAEVLKDARVGVSPRKGSLDIAADNPPLGRDTAEGVMGQDLWTGHYDGAAGVMAHRS
jgi:hypothetical protein